MIYRDIFNQSEWVTLELTVLWMFKAIAGADKKIDIQELDAMTVIQENADKFDSELIKEVLSSLKYNLDDITNIFAIDDTEIKAGLRKSADLLKSKIDKEKALLFKKSVLSIGMFIAFASGDIFSSKMSNVESQTLTELALYMRISLPKLNEPPTIQDLMDKISK